MRKKLLMLAAVMLVFGCLAWAKTITGVVSDSMCGAKHATASDDAAHRFTIGRSVTADGHAFRLFAAASAD